MSEEEKRKMELEQKRKQMRELRREIEELEAPRSLSWRMKHGILDVSMRNEVRTVPFSNSNAWLDIRALALELYRPKHRGVKMRVTTLTGSESETAAEMADRIVELWNEYVERIYGGGTN